MSTRFSLSALFRCVALGALGGVPLAFIACSSFSAANDPVVSSTPEGGSPDAPAGTDSSIGADADAVVVEAAGPSAYRAAVLNDAPLAYWRMGIASGLIVPDETGNNNPLLLQGAGVTLGVAGATPSDGDTAISFDGLTGSAVADNARAFDFSAKAPFTLECWARYTPLVGGGGAYPTLFAAVEGYNATANGYLLYVIKTYNILQLDYAGGAVASTPLTTGPPQWTHYAVTHDGTSINLYVGGTLKKTSPPTGANTARASSFTIGARGTSEYFPGGIDEVAVYTRALSVGEFVAHISAR